LEVDYSTESDRQLRRYRVDPVAAERLLVQSAPLAPPCWLQSRIWPLLCQDIAALTLAGDLRDLRLAQRSGACSPRLPGVAVRLSRLRLAAPSVEW
jgi:hypothetical protein